MNDILQSLPWLQHNWSQLAGYIAQDRVPQALLISGNKGLGKQPLAETYATALLCDLPQADGMACGQCQSCLLFKAETHPDYIVIEPEEPGKSIGIGVIRQLTAKLSLKPQFDNYRVVIINPADNLNAASANAFLKFLEEPTERTCLVLITEKPAKLPATIRSRCQKMQLSAPTDDVLVSWLQQQGIEKDTDILLHLSQGSPLLAKQLAESTLLQLRAECFSNWLKFTQAKLNFVELAEQWNKLEKAEIEFLLFWLISWVADMVKLGFGGQSVNLLNPDLASNLQELRQRLDLTNIYKYYDFLLLGHKRLDTQINKQLMFEEILIKWSELNNR